MPLTGKFLPDTKKNQFGGSVGGPIVENQMFFFGDYQGTSQYGGRLPPAVGADRGRADRRPERLRRQHLRSADPGVPAVRTQFPGNVIPANRLSPQAQAILQLIPTAERARRDRTAHATTSSRPSRRTFNEDSFNVRIDGRLGAGTNTFGRYSRGKFLRDGPTAFGPGGGRELVSLGGVSDVKNQSLAYGLDHAFSSSAADRLPLRLLPLQRRTCCRSTTARRQPPTPGSRA